MQSWWVKPSSLTNTTGNMHENSWNLKERKHSIIRIRIGNGMDGTTKTNRLTASGQHPSSRLARRCSDLSNSCSWQRITAQHGAPPVPHRKPVLALVGCGVCFVSLLLLLSLAVVHPKWSPGFSRFPVLQKLSLAHCVWGPGHRMCSSERVCRT